MAQYKAISPRQVRAITALLQSRNITTACERARIPRRTLYRWFDDKSFQEALQKAESEAIGNVTRSLLAGSETALEVLYQVMVEGDETNIRRNASTSWLNLAMKYKEIADILPRIERLERIYEEKRNG